MAKLKYQQLQKGDYIVLDNYPYQILDLKLMFKGRGHSVLQAKIKNLETSAIVEKTFHPSDEFEEAEIEKIDLTFLFAKKDKAIFLDPTKRRVEIPLEKLEDRLGFLKKGTEVKALKFKEKIINIELPIKVVLKVVSAPPGVKGDSAQSATKAVTLETGLEIQVPLFVKEGDLIEVNTETKEYIRRV